MKITILGSGTSQGVPVIGCDCEVCNSMDYRDQRLRVSVWIEIQGLHFVIDTGPDFRQQMLKARLPRLDAVLFTHQHRDHTAGMDDLRSFNFKQNEDIPIYAREAVLEQLKREFAYIFVPPEKKYPGVLTVETHIIENEPFEIKGIPIIPIEGMHHKLPVFGFRIGDFVYLTDVNAIPETEWHKLEGTKILILDALQKEDHISHYTLSQAVEVIQRLQPEKAYLTHISHKMGLHKQINQELPANIELAYDGLVLELP
jgi:phosphoribosyl 1,2-cyclic phosphate phosphodiesterase